MGKNMKICIGLWSVFPKNALLLDFFPGKQIRCNQHLEIYRGRNKPEIQVGADSYIS